MIVHTPNTPQYVIVERPCSLSKTLSCSLLKTKHIYYISFSFQSIVSNVITRAVIKQNWFVFEAIKPKVKLTWQTAAIEVSIVFIF